MDGLIDALGMVCAVGVVAGIIGLIRPYWFLKRRWQAGALIVGLLVATGALMQVPVSRPADVTPTEWARRMDICRAAHDVRKCPLTTASVASAEADLAKERLKAQATATAAVPVGNSVAVVDAGADAHASFRRTQAKMLEVTGPCDKALRVAINSSGRNRSYNNAMAAKEACHANMLDLNGVRFEAPVSQEARDDLNKAMDCFGKAYAGRVVAMEEAAKLMDASDEHPSKVAEYQQSLRFALEDGQACGVQYAGAAVRHGFGEDVAKGKAALNPKG